MEKFLSDTNEVKRLRSLTQTVDTAPNISKFQKVLIIYGLIFLVYIILLSFTSLRTSDWNYIASLANGLPSFIGGFLIVIRSMRWGEFNNNIRKAIFFISLGVFCWGSGNMVWAYYDFFQNIAVPYPSWADAGFFSAGILWITGIIYLSQATGTKFSLKKRLSKLFFLVIPIIILTVSCYFLLFVIKRNFISEEPLKIFFDLIYPSMDIIILSIAIIIFGLSVNVFKGKYRLSLFSILAGFVCMYLADFTFSYTTSTGVYYNGSFVDLLFGIAQFLLTWGTLSFYLTPKRT